VSSFGWVKLTPRRRDTDRNTVTPAVTMRERRGLGPAGAAQPDPAR
jgi:hypothetical protein